MSLTLYTRKRELTDIVQFVILHNRMVGEAYEYDFKGECKMHAL